MSLCEVNCDYEGYNSEIKKAKCECQVKIKLPLISEIVINKDRLLNNFVDIRYSTNFKTMKCGNVIFTKEGLKNNIGNYSTLLIILIILSNTILFIFKGFKLLCDIIDIIIENKQNVVNDSSKVENKNNQNINGKIIEKDDKKEIINFNSNNLIINNGNINNKISKNKNSKKKKSTKKNKYFKN